MSIAQPPAPAASPTTTPTAGSDPATHGRTWFLAARLAAGFAIALVVALGRLPVLARSLSPDEGGYLLVASQWRPGTSLYGNYWVDRPPVLIAIFDLAARLGGAVPLRLIGVLAVVVSILLAGLLGRLASPLPARHSTWLPAVAAATMLSMPLFDTGEVNGELLAVPLVLAGAVGVVSCVRTPRTTRAWVWGALGGAAATSAALVKQNVVDVFVLAAALAMCLALGATSRARARRLVAVAVGAVVALVLVTAYAASRGTTPGELWYAVVGFRFDAAALIRASASSATAARLAQLLGALILSGAPLFAVVAGWVARAQLPGTTDAAAERAVIDLRVPAAAVLGWELLAVMLGGSYWLHYLVGLVPGLVLMAVAASQRPLRARPRAALLAALSWPAVLAVVGAATLPHVGAGSDASIIGYLRAHDRTGDTLVVAFGHPNIVQAAGLPSPYSELWSLPVRVRDPRLSHFDDVLSDPNRPTWVVVSGQTLYTWGVDATSAESTLQHRYHEVADAYPYRVYLRNRFVRSTGAGPA